MSFEVVPFPNAEILARTAAEAWIAALKAPAEGPPYSVGLAGGRIAARFFSELTKLETATRAALNSVHFFWGDERCVPPEDPESNFGLAERLLFIALSVPENQIHRIRGEEPPEQAALEAEKELRAVAVEQTRGQPVLDMVFLGMGEDGHVASLFPGESEALVASPA